MVTDIDDELRRKAFLDALFESGLLISTGVMGVYGANHVFDDVLQRLNDLITRTGLDDNPEVVRFPPVISREDFTRSDYMRSFPQFAGIVFSFDGDQVQHMKLMDCIHEGKDWNEYEAMTDVVLTPAACYPVYPMAARRGVVPAEGRLFDVLSYCFRHEPSTDPARMQIFRMREFVRISTGDAAVVWRDSWLERGLALLTSLGLAVKSDLANDPFFGRGGRMLAANQRNERLKFELLVPICSETNPTAVMSFNYHQDHFGTLFGLELAGSEPSHTACVGFGMERIVLALFKTHGLDPQKWPVEVRERMWVA